MQDSEIITIINQIFEIEKKSKGSNLEKTIGRNIKRLNKALEEANVRYVNPIGQNYDETRLDCEAMIDNSASQQLTIKEVIKPIILKIDSGQNHILQRAVVIVS